MNAFWTRGLGLLQAGATGLLGATLPDGLRFSEPMQLRSRGEPVSPERLACRYAQEGAGREVVVFLHGLMADENCWLNEARSARSLRSRAHLAMLIISPMRTERCSSDPDSGGESVALGRQALRALFDAVHDLAAVSREKKRHLGPSQQPVTVQYCAAQYSCALRNPSPAEIHILSVVAALRSTQDWPNASAKNLKVPVRLSGALDSARSYWLAPTFNMSAAFERDFNLFTVHVRYDTGRHISENGLALARLLEAWFRAPGPVPGRLHFVAHSMGGLVTRSALHQAREQDMRFTAAVDRVVLLATPNRGAPLEKGVQALQLLLQAAPHPLRITSQGLRLLFSRLRVGDQTPLAPVADITDFYVHTLPAFHIRLASRILPLRSDGIRDLRHGYMLRQEWERPQAWGGLKPQKLPVPPLPGARYYAVAGSLSRNPPAQPCARVMDGMVTTASAANRGGDDELRFVDNGRYRLIPGLNHFVMPMSPEVYEVLREWFSSTTS